jgi:rhodanese-related sulfurtransferase
LKKILLGLLFTASMLMAELQHIWATPDFADKKIKIIDIRTPSEWKETGIVKDSYTIMFFDEKGNFNVKNFLKQLMMAVKKEEQFALICRVGSRTGMVSEFLSEKLGYKVINLKGGIMKMMHEGYKTVPYKQ